MVKDERYYNALTKIALIIKARDNPKWLGAVTGEVVKAPPELEVKLESGIIIKNKKINNLYINLFYINYFKYFIKIYYLK